MALLQVAGAPGDAVRRLVEHCREPLELAQRRFLFSKFEHRLVVELRRVVNVEPEGGGVHDAGGVCDSTAKWHELRVPLRAQQRADQREVGGVAAAGAVGRQFSASVGRARWGLRACSKGSGSGRRRRGAR